jgi:hypothetical protein
MEGAAWEGKENENMIAQFSATWKLGGKRDKFDESQKDLLIIERRL